MSSNKGRLRLKKKSRKLLNIITGNAERRPRRLLRRNASRTRKRKRSKDSESNKRRPPIVRPTSMPSEPREPWRRLTEKPVPEKNAKPRNK